MSRYKTLERLEQRTMLTSSATFAVESLRVEADTAISYRLGDLDGDGLFDVAILGPSEITWFRQVNDARKFERRQSFEVQSSHFDLIDLDGDQRLDLVFAAANRIQWHRNTGSGEFESESRDLAAAPQADSFVAADTDNDGDSDLLIPFPDGSILHLENTGLGTFHTKEQIDGVAEELAEISVADLNNDMAVDVLIASSSGVSWYDNVDGYFNGQDSRHDIEDDEASSPQLADMDNDHDIDVVLRRASLDGGELVWLENEDGSFTHDHLIRVESPLEMPSTAFAGDIDRDGDTDIASFHASADATNNTLLVFLNADRGETLRGRQLMGSDVKLVGLGRASDDSCLEILAIRNDGQLITFDFRVVGDVNRDGFFDSSDLIEVLQYGHYEDGVTANSTFREGDFNGDHEFNSSDLVLAFQAGTYERLSYPRLIFTRQDVPGLKAKLENPTLKSRFEQVLEQALSTIDVDYSDPSLYESDKANDGQRYAFLSLMLDHDDPLRALMARKARDVLAHANEGRWQAFSRFPERQATFDLSEALHPWNTGTVLMNLSLTYDWLVGAGELTGVAQQDARFRILRLAQMEHIQQSTPYDEFDHQKYPFRLSNYTFRSLAGVGFAALAFPEQKGLINDPYERLAPEHQTEFDTSEALQWVLHELFEEITTSSTDNPANGQSLIEHFISVDGMVREGFYYQNDTLGILIPFLVMLDRLYGDDYLSSGGLSDGRILKVFESDFRVMLPSGQRPLVGDAYVGHWYMWHELIAAYTDDPGVHYWEARKGTNNLGISLPFYDETIPYTQPEYRTEFLPDAGLAVFRDQWGPDATYLMLVAQDAPVMGHDQADQGSISLYAHGTPLVIETGYGSAYRGDPEERRGGKEDWINSALGHSTMTIDSVYTIETTPRLNLWRDGVTPSIELSYTKVPDPARIENTFATRHIDYAEAHVTYTEKRANLLRAVAFPRHRYFILEDTMTSDSPHHYGWQLQLGNSDAGRLTGSDQTYVWSIPNSRNQDVSLAIHMLDDQDRNVNVYDNGPTNRKGYLYPDHVFDHTYMLADKHAQDVKFVTLLDPYQDESAKLQVETLVEGKIWKVVHSDTSYDLILSQAESTEVQFGEIRTDARFVVASVDTLNGQDVVVSVFARGGTDLQIGYDQQRTFQIPDGTPFHFEPR